MSPSSDPGTRLLGVWGSSTPKRHKADFNHFLPLNLILPQWSQHSGCFHTQQDKGRRLRHDTVPFQAEARILDSLSALLWILKGVLLAPGTEPGAGAYLSFRFFTCKMGIIPRFRGALTALHLRSPRDLDYIPLGKMRTAASSIRKGLDSVCEARGPLTSCCGGIFPQSRADTSF